MLLSLKIKSLLNYFKISLACQVSNLYQNFLIMMGCIAEDSQSQSLLKWLPDFIAVWVPFIFGTFKKPAAHPIIAPPGKTGYGIDWNITSIKFLYV